MPQPDREPAQSPPPPGRWRALAARLRSVPAWTRAHALLLSVVVAALFLPLVGLAYLRHLAAPKRAPAQPAATLEMALQALDRGALEDAQALANSLEFPATGAPPANGGPPFILGAVASRRAEDLLGAEKARQHLLAARYLEDARQRGFPPGREAEGLSLLGEDLLRAGRIAESVPVLHAALAAGPAHFIPLHRLLAEAHETAPQPDFALALEHIDSCLAEPGLNETERDDLLLDRARIQFHQRDLAGCRETLQRLPPDWAAAAVLRGRLALDEAERLLSAAGAPDAAPRDEQTDRLLQEALAALRQAQGRGGDTAAGREAMLTLGRALRLAGDGQAALAQFHRTWQLHAESPEGLAAGVAEADLLLQQGRWSEAAAAWQRMLETVGPLDEYANPWLSLDALRQSALGAYQRLLEQGQFAESVSLASALGPLFPAARRLQLEAEARRAWGRRLLADTPSAGASADENTSQGRAELRAAGRVWLRVAALRIAERDYSDQLWNAAEVLLAGQDYSAAADAFREYLAQEARKRRAIALLGLGEALLGTGDVHGSLAALDECTRMFPRDSAGFRARLLAARAQVLGGEMGPALDLLRENIEGDYLTPASGEWRDSLFELGRLLHLDRKYAEAISRLEEAVVRYPDAPQSAEARYLIADSYTQSARPVQEKLAQATADTARAAHAREVQRLLTTAVGRYQDELDWLRAKEETAGLSTAEEAFVRNSYLFQGAALFDLGRYEDAIQAYSSVTNRYQHSPVALEAYVRIADCYRRLDRPTEFRGTLERARIVLRRLPADAPFDALTIHTRDEWTGLLDWLTAL